MYPDLNKFRRVVVPLLERNEHRLFGRDIMFTKEAQDVCYAGVISGADVDTVVSQLRKMDNTFPCNLAALKWRDTPHGRLYERASYAYRPEGFRGKWQYHVRLWPHERGTAVFAHKELNPWHSPRKHYHSTRGKTWLPHKGIEWVHEQFVVDTGANIENIQPV